LEFAETCDNVLGNRFVLAYLTTIEKRKRNGTSYPVPTSVPILAAKALKLRLEFRVDAFNIFSVTINADIAEVKIASSS